MRIVALTVLGIVLFSFEASALDEALYARVLERYTVAVDDIASTRVDYAALGASEQWSVLLESLRTSNPRRLRSRDSMGEPRIHAAIVCASLSCPPLRREPYRAADLDAQLEDNVRRWLADPRKGARIDRSARTLYLSPIFGWFEDDFGHDVLSFVAAHLPPEEASWIRTQGSALRIRDLGYDWSLNDAQLYDAEERSTP